MLMNVMEPWWKTGIIYEIYPRSFKDTNNDGVGDLRGIIECLDYLNNGTEESLGVDAIWITPFYPSPLHDFGYDVQDYCGIDPIYGTMDDFDELLEKAHQRNIRIIIDLVFNHSSHLHSWFQESSSSRDNPKRDWYIWRDGKSYWRKPNNWKAFFGGPTWTYDAITGQYYLHTFLKEQPDLNWRNREVQKALFKIVRYWLRKGVDGFRLDVINLIYKDLELRSNPCCFGRRPFEMQRHIYDRNQPEAHKALHELRQLVDSYGDKMLVGEITLDKFEDAQVAARFYGEKNDELHLAFNFDFLHRPWTAKAFREAVAFWEKTLPEGGWPNYVLSNHDFPRHFSRYAKRGVSEKRARIAALMLLTLRGTPFLYYGEEIGMRNVFIPRWKFQDPVGKRYWPFHPGRDEERTPMQWDDSENAGFTKNKPWLPIAKDFQRVNVAKQKNDPDSLFSFYRKLIWFRKKNKTLQSGNYRVIEGLDERIFAYVREDEEKKYMIVLNFSSKPLTINLKNYSLSGEVLISTIKKSERKKLHNKLKIDGDEGLLIHLNIVE